MEPDDEIVVPTGDQLYDALAAPFDVTFRDNRGGAEFTYITGEQATTRLNETLGFMNWSFRIVEHGIHPEADECWALGELTVTRVIEGFGGVQTQTVVKQQFGSQKVKRSRSSGTPLDIGFDLKGAGTDALKKCASLVGVALYLWKKEPGLSTAGQTGSRPPQNQGQANTGYRPPQNQGQGQQGNDGYQAARTGFNPNAGAQEAFDCEECNEPLTETRFKDGTNWDPAKLAQFGRRKHSRVLCMTHYREANQAKQRAEEALQQVPF
jgi:hypothetical protein